MKNKILIIDDETSILNQIARTLLIMTELEVSTCLNVDTAKEKISNTDYDLIVSDCNLDGNIMAGRELFNFMEELYSKKTEEEMKGIYGKPYWIFMSGDVEVLKGVKSLPGSTFIEKPFLDSDISSAILSSMNIRSNKKIERKIRIVKKESDKRIDLLCSKIDSVLQHQDISNEKIDKMFAVFSEKEESKDKEKWTDEEIKLTLYNRNKKSLSFYFWAVVKDVKFWLALVVGVIGLVFAKLS